MSSSTVNHPAEAAAHVRSIPAGRQATGAFDRGKITERKPIGMPHDLAPQKSIGPLFYWAWAESDESGTIAMHPHQGFEILSYVLEGEMLHRDSLGSDSRVTAGGVQVQQAGSGMSHEEITGPQKTSFFQIWLQPDLQSALRRSPRYGEYFHHSFSISERSGVSVKNILGPRSPISLVSDARMDDIRIAAGASYARHLNSGRALIAVAVDGSGEWTSIDQGNVETMEAADCTTWVAHRDSPLELKALGGSSLRAVLIEVPLEVGYPLYR